MNREAYFKARRKAWVASGLTTSGKERINKRHPELDGLKGNDYHREYMRKQRRADREAWSVPV